MCLIDMASRRNVQYSPLPTDEDNDYGSSGKRQYDPRFDYSPKAFDKIPWKSIALALFLLSLGLVLLFLSYFIMTGHMGGDQSQAYGLLALGILSFLPGMSTFFFFPFWWQMICNLFSFIETGVSHSTTPPTPPFSLIQKKNLKLFNWYMTSPFIQTKNLEKN